MRVPDEIRKYAVYIGYEPNDGYGVSGTGFLVDASCLDRARPGPPYVVTAGHVVDGIENARLGQGDPSLKTSKVCVRVNDCTGGTYEVQYEPHEWFRLPGLSTSDVAVARLPAAGSQYDQLVIPTNRFLLGANWSTVDVHLGQEVCIPSLSVNKPGPQRNLPVIRIGTVAAMDSEPIELKPAGRAVVHLIEVRSTGGVSGSPMLVCRVSDAVGHYSLDDWYLLGLLRSRATYEGASGPNSWRTETVNAGLSLAVPADQILTVLQQAIYNGF
jgi:hypothetical protein